ncbi:nitroreductase A [uncultured Clostridium sp.]|nr:nitroreductase A [uncultured Clostridium sp.]
MFDAGIAAQTFCLAAHEAGLGSVIMGVFDIEGISRLLHLPDTQELAALIAVGYPDEAPDAPRRKTTEQLLTYLQEENK